MMAVAADKPAAMADTQDTPEGYEVSPREPQLSISTSGSALESHPIVFSPLSRTESAVAPPTPHCPPPADEPRSAGAGEDAGDQDTDSLAANDEAHGHGSPELAAHQLESESVGVHRSTVNAAEVSEGHTDKVSEVEGSPLQLAAEAAVPGSGAEGQRSSNAEVEGDTESDPSTPVAVREALAAVHSLAIRTGVLGSDATPSAGPSVTGSGRPGSVATASDSEGEGSGDGSSLAAARLSKTAPASPTTVLSGSPSVAVPSPGAHVAAAATVVASKLNVAAKEWVPPGTPSVAAPAANESNIRYQQHANDFQYNGWGGDGSYDANSNGYDYGYAGWQGGETNGSNWGAPEYSNGDASYYQQYGPEAYQPDGFLETAAYGYQEAAAYYPQKTEEAAVAVLAMAFSGYSLASLRKVLRKAGHDIGAAAEELTLMEAEHAGQLKVVTAVRKAAKQPTGPPAPVLDEDNFPALGAAGPSPTKGAAPAWAGSSQVKDSVKAAPAPSEATQATATRTGSGSSASLTPPRSENGRRAGDGPAAPVEWVETGKAVSAQYAEARAEARQKALLRNACFQQATQAYLAGNKALAKELGAQGRAANQAMKEAHAAASERIYSARNSNAAHTGEPLIDLHGQHAAEGVATLRRELARMRSTPVGGGGGGKAGGAAQRTVHVLVGTGHHTKGAKTPARLPAAVERFLQERGLPYSEPQPGLLKLML